MSAFSERVIPASIRRVRASDATVQGMTRAELVEYAGWCHEQLHAHKLRLNERASDKARQHRVIKRLSAELDRYKDLCIKQALALAEMDPGAPELSVAIHATTVGNALGLAKRPLGVLLTLLHAKGAYVSRAVMEECIWGIHDFTPKSNTVAVFISKIRAVLRKEFPDLVIRNQHGVGWKIDIGPVRDRLIKRLDIRNIDA